MDFAQHGRIGASLFIVMLVLPAVAVIPVTLVFTNLGLWYGVVTVGLLVISAWPTSHLIVRSGGGGAGEPLGCLAGLLSWLGMWGAAKLWEWSAGATEFREFVSFAGAAATLLLSSFVWWQRLRTRPLV